MPSFNQISISQLSRLIGTPQSPVIIDVRIDEDVTSDPYLIPTARRYPHTDVAALVPDLEHKKVVVVCQKGLKLSQGAAALLRSYGISAEYLEGGSLAWREKQEVVIPLNKLKGSNPSSCKQGSLWVTKQRPKVDRIACPWFIRRFIDPYARFLFVAESEVMAVSERFSAISFDVEGADWEHQGNLCSFDMILADLNITVAPLQHLAAIVRGADTGQLSLTPQSAGLLAVSLGLSKMCIDDVTQLEIGMTIYDALYRWVRDAYNETHLHTISLLEEQ